MSTRLCVDCLYFIHSNSKCGARQLEDPVRGIPYAPSAAIERAATHKEACGPKAKHYRVIVPVTA
jgi:hypothetical protein